MPSKNITGIVNLFVDSIQLLTKPSGYDSRGTLLKLS